MRENENGTRETVTPASLYALNDEGIYNLLLEEDCLLIYSGEDTDFGIGTSKVQNETFSFESRRRKLIPASDHRCGAD